MAKKKTPASTSDEVSFENSMREALAHLDVLKASLEKERNKAVDDQIAAEQKLHEIIRDAEHQATYAFHAKHSEIEKKLRAEVRVDYLQKMILFGVPSTQLKKTLEVTSDELAQAWMNLNFVPIDQQHVAMVRYDEQGRAGHVIFYREDKVVRFFFEFGGGNTLAYVDIPSPEEWTASTGFPMEDRAGILEYIAKDIIRVKAPGYTYEITKRAIRIYK